jgi:transformation/transcription domain-associated protein
MPLQQQQQLQQQLQQQVAQSQHVPLPAESPSLVASVPGTLASQTGSEDVVMADSPTKPEQPGSTAPPAPSSNPTQQPLAQSTLDPVVPPNVERKPWDYIDEIVALLKTGHPLLALTLETIVDQMRDRLKADGDEELYRAICALQADALQVGHSYFTLLHHSNR